jgi:hypothetical protein
MSANAGTYGDPIRKRRASSGTAADVVEKNAPRVSASNRSSPHTIRDAIPAAARPVRAAPPHARVVLVCTGARYEPHRCVVESCKPELPGHPEDLGDLAVEPISTSAQQVRNRDGEGEQDSARNHLSHDLNCRPFGNGADVGFGLVCKTRLVTQGLGKCLTARAASSGQVPPCTKRRRALRNPPGLPFRVRKRRLLDLRSHMHIVCPACLRPDGFCRRCNDNSRLRATVPWSRVGEIAKRSRSGPILL